MTNWLKAACLAVGAGLAFASVASDDKAEPATGAATAGTVRAGTVVDIKPNRIYLTDIEKAGERLVAVGERGFVLVSDDAGKSWRAIGTPVVRALTGVAFNGDKVGVAVGHGGSLVRPEDGGDTWTEVPMDEAYGESLLGVTALGDGRFVAYGAFGMYFDTTDGGRSWAKRTILNEDFDRHISQVVQANGLLWLVGESGTMATCDALCTDYVEATAPYEGSFFGMVVARDGALLVFGMRGSVYRSADNGQTWEKVDIDTTASFNGGRTLADGRIILVGNAGLVATSKDDGRTFATQWSPASRGFSAVVEAGDRLVVAGEAGVEVLDTAALLTK
jgi:photosystem II stability/assembly factor-like uncharacterized protein